MGSEPCVRPTPSSTSAAIENSDRLASVRGRTSREKPPRRSAYNPARLI